MDTLTRRRRGEVMSRVRSRNTAPELAVRKLLFALGYRFRVNMPGLPGTPDIAFTRKKKAIFVHGCFWHQHSGCPRNRPPKSNRAYWAPKLARNKERDRENRAALRRKGWLCLAVWECELSDFKLLSRKLRKFLQLPLTRRSR